MVTMIGHLSGRLLARRAPYEFDLQRLLEVAAETQTIIELNASPWRLDMDWRHWPQARELGVICSINPDAHSTRGLQDLLFGVRAARKGWLRREDILNTLPLEQVREALGHKRRTHGLG
jgi:DNA polymerase (family 10)